MSALDEAESRSSVLATAARSSGRAVRDAARATLYGRWPRAPRLTEGYSVLMPLPGDLPVFLELALAAFERQEPAGLVETIVVPDQMTPEFARAYERATARHDWGPVRLVEIGQLGRMFQRARSDPFLNHFLQVYHGAAAARSTHALLHDADLFLTDGTFLAERYRRCVDRELAYLGVEARYDDWYERHVVGPVMATWELMFDVRWVRKFPPWQLHSHRNRVNGATREFDTMDYVQARTPPERRELWEAPGSYVHFNWAICVYRYFQEAAGQPFEDDRFLILLISLLTDALGGDRSAGLPPVAELARGIADPSARVTYRGPEREEKYAEFRRRLGGVLDGDLIEPGRADAIDAALAPFDAAFG